MGVRETCVCRSRPKCGGLDVVVRAIRSADRETGEFSLGGPTLVMYLNRMVSAYLLLTAVQRGLSTPTRSTLTADVERNGVSSYSARASLVVQM